MKGKTALGIGLMALIFGVFGTPVIIFRYKPIKEIVEGQMIPNTIWVSSNPTLFWVFLSLFIVAMISVVVGIVLYQKKSEGV